MSINITTWSPDTCDCQIHYAWDDTVPQDERVHTPVEGVTSHDGTFIPTRRCHHHAHHHDTKAHHDTVVEENQRKNKLHAKLAEAFPVLATADADGNMTLKHGATSWAFDDKRVLHVTIPNLSPAQKTEAQSLADAHAGGGRVNIK